MTTRPAAIFLEIDSEGGEVDAGFALTKAIEASPVPVICIVDGQAASMAFYVLQSCDVRAMTPRSSLMMHQVTLIGAIKASNIKALQKQIDTYNKAMVGQCAAKMKLTSAQISAKIADGDWWMGTDEALEVGAIDSVVPVSSLP
jgi:ATP-dependent Clp protease protease subunit